MSLPQDWKKQALWAKAQYDKHNCITLAIIFPMEWMEEMRSLSDFDKDDKGNLYLWGADIYFGPVDKIVAGGKHYMFKS
jgi:hypothetical protein